MTGFCERPAIVAVGYNRPESMKRLLRSIGEAHYEWDDIPLIISIDKSDVKEVQEIAEAFEWKYGAKRVSLHRERLGLRNHILECGDYAIQYGAVIILEDDREVAPDFYN